MLFEKNNHILYLEDKFSMREIMFTFITIDFIVMAIGCIVVDKIEEFFEDKSKEKRFVDIINKDKDVDIDTLNILKNYGLVNIEQLEI